MKTKILFGTFIAFALISCHQEEVKPIVNASLNELKANEGSSLQISTADGPRYIESDEENSTQSDFMKEKDARARENDS